MSKKHKDRKKQSAKSKVRKTVNVIAQKKKSCKTICSLMWISLLLSVLCFCSFHTHHADSWHISVISFQSCEYTHRLKHYCYILQDTSGQEYEIPIRWFNEAEQQQLLTDISVGDTLYIRWHRWHRYFIPNRKIVDTLESDNAVYRSLEDARQEKGYGSLTGGIFFLLTVLTEVYFLYRNLREIHQLKKCKQEFYIEE